MKTKKYITQKYTTTRADLLLHHHHHHHHQGVPKAQIPLNFSPSIPIGHWSW